VVNATNPNLSAFAAHGGKLLMFHGWADPLISPLDAVAYYGRITAKGRDKSDFVRLFMAPGVGHCGGGAGPDIFGQELSQPAGTPDNDMVAALDRWAETGVAPDRVIARKFGDTVPGPPPPNPVPFPAEPRLSRPLCAYPKVMRYDGRGDSTKAESFECVNAAPIDHEMPPAKYLR
jgi:feruloyl esterase